MNIRVDGNNFFHTGWLACYLGLPKEPPPEYAALKPADRDAFRDGWEMCSETPTGGYPSIYDAFAEMVRRGQAHVFWEAER